jgi:hypothetical protein
MGDEHSILFQCLLCISNIIIEKLEEKTPVQKLVKNRELTTGSIFMVS